MAITTATVDKGIPVAMEIVVNVTVIQGASIVMPVEEEAFRPIPVALQRMAIKPVNTTPGMDKMVVIIKTSNRYVRALLITALTPSPVQVVILARLQ